MADLSFLGKNLLGLLYIDDFSIHVFIRDIPTLAPFLPWPKAWPLLPSALKLFSGGNSSTALRGPEHKYKRHKQVEKNVCGEGWK